MIFFTFFTFVGLKFFFCKKSILFSWFVFFLDDEEEVRGPMGTVKGVTLTFLFSFSLHTSRMKRWSSDAVVSRFKASLG